MIAAALLALATLTPVPGTNPDFQQLHQEHLALARSGKVEVAFLGDSITRLWRSRGKTPWGRYFMPHGAANFGVSGDRLENLQWRIQHGILDGYKAKGIVLLIGTNNRDQNAGEIVAGVGEILAEIRQRQPQARVLLLGLLPSGPKDGDVRRKFKRVNEWLATYANERTTFLDVGDRFLTPEGAIDRNLISDGTHPTAAGYDVLAGAIVESVQKLRGAPAAGPKPAGGARKAP